MIKPRWQLELEAFAEELRQEAARRRLVTPTDPVSDALCFAADRAEVRIRRLQEPTVMLSPAAWGAEQEPPIEESTVRRYCRAGQLDHQRDDNQNFLIPADARRRLRAAPDALAPLDRVG